jgi:hypothetical protein
MRRTDSLIVGVTDELSHYFVKPRTTLNSLIVNSIISFGFFAVSYWLGTYNPQLVPIAAATILLWALADSSLTNQLLYNKEQNRTELKRHGSLKRLLLIKNLAVVVLSIPLTLLFGLFLVLIVGKWSEVLYGTVMALILIWGWLGISNALSVLLPFELVSVKQYASDKHIWIRYGFLYCLPWVLLPAYAIIMGLPLYLLGWTKLDTAQNHRILGLSILLLLSLAMWSGGLNIADKYAKRANTKIKRFFASL